MSCYVVAQLAIHDREEYSHYEAGFMDVFSRYQGKLLAVDENIEILEGSWPYTRTVIIEFPDKNAVKAWYESSDYQKLAQHRFAASRGNIVITSGLE